MQVRLWDTTIDVFVPYRAHGFLRTGPFSVPIHYPGATRMECSGINDAGQIVGWWNREDSIARRGFLRDASGGFTNIYYPGAINTRCSGINNAGQIVGVYWHYGVRHNGFLRGVDGSFTLIDYPGAIDTECYGINDAGQVVGAYRDDFSEPRRGFLRMYGSFTSIDYPGAINTSCYGINDAGQIVGAYEDAGGTMHGFVATPAVCKCSTNSKMGCISGTVWVVPLDRPSVNSTVILTRKKPKPMIIIGETRTLSNGCYLFTDLEDGIYKVTVVNCKGGGVKTIKIDKGGKVNDVNFSCRIGGKPGK